MNEYFIYQQRYNTVKTVNYSYIKLVEKNYLETRVGNPGFQLVRNFFRFWWVGNLIDHHYMS